MWPCSQLSSLALLLSAALLPAQDEAGDPLARLRDLPVRTTTSVRSVEVQVVGADGRPRPQALLVAATREAMVRHGGPGESLVDGRCRDQLRQAAALLLLAGQRLPLDANGAAKVPASELLLLLAVDGDAAAVEFVRRPRQGGGPDRVVLTMRPPRRVRVVAVRADGQPAAGVDLECVPPGLRSAPAAAHTAPDGSATIAVPVVASGVELVVRAVLPTDSTLQQRVPEGDEPVRLQLPPCGSVRVQLGGGLRGGKVTLLAFGGGAAWAELAADATGVTFPFAEPGIPLQVQVEPGNAVGDLVQVVPMFFAGETATVRPGEDATRLALRPLDAAGAPCPETWFGYTFSNRLLPARVRTDAEGRLQLLMPMGAKWLCVERRCEQGAAVFAADSVVVACDGFKPGDHDCGDQPLQAEPLLVGGCVVDGQDKPVAGAVLEFLSVGGLHGVPISRRITTGADGAFACHWRSPQPDKVSVRIVSDAWRHAGPSTFEAGSRRVEVRAERLGLVPLHLADFPEHTYADLTVIGAGDGGRASMLLEGADGDLRLPAGRCRIELLLGDEVVLGIDDVDVDPLVETHDPRLRQIDWRAFGSIAVIHVEGADGKPLEECLVSRRQATGMRGRQHRAWGGTARFLVPTAGIDVDLHPADRRLQPVLLPMFRGERTVRLQKAQVARVQLTAMPQLPPGIELVAVLRTDTATSEVQSVRFDGGGLGECPIFFRGTARLQLKIVKSVGTTATKVMAVLPQTVELGDESVDVTVPIDEKLRQTIEQAAAALPR